MAHLAGVRRCVVTLEDAFSFWFSVLLVAEFDSNRLQTVKSIREGANKKNVIKRGGGRGQPSVRN